MATEAVKRRSQYGALELMKLLLLPAFKSHFSKLWKTRFGNALVDYALMSAHREAALFQPPVKGESRESGW